MEIIVEYWVKFYGSIPLREWLFIILIGACVAFCIKSMHSMAHKVQVVIFSMFFIWLLEVITGMRFLEMSIEYLKDKFYALWFPTCLCVYLTTMMMGRVKFKEAFFYALKYSLILFTFLLLI